MRVSAFWFGVERNRGTFPGSPSDLRLRIHAHPGGYCTPRALVTIPIRHVRMGARVVPLHNTKHRTDHPADVENQGVEARRAWPETVVVCVFFPSATE